MIANLRARLLPGLLVVAASIVGQVTVARADVSISVAPSLVELNATPGGTGAVELTVVNEGDEPFEVTAGIDQYKDGTDDRSAVDWLSVEPASFRLAPGEQRQARVQVTVPSGLSSGGRYALVVFRTAAAGASGSRVGVSGQVGVPLLIDVQAAEPLIREADITQLVPVLEPTGGLGFWTAVQSRGNLHVASLGGAIDLSRADGSGAGRLDLPESTAILPSSAEPLVTDGSLAFEPNAVYHASGSVAYGGAAPATADIGFTARADLALTDLATTDGGAAGTAIALGMHNQGELGLLPRIDFSIRDAAGHTLETAAPPRPPLLLPGQTAEIRTQLPKKLAPGEYVLTAHAQYGSTTLDREVSFTIGAGGATLAQAQPADRLAAASSTSAMRDNAQASAASAQTGSAQPIGLLLFVVLGLAGVASLVWLPALAPLRRRFHRAARSFAESD